MSDSQPESPESTQTMGDRVDSPNAPSPPDLEGSAYGFQDDASSQDSEDREEGETLLPNTDQEDVIPPVDLPPAGTIPVNTASPDGIANPATSPSLEESVANLTVSLNNINGLLRGVLEMVITQNLQTGTVMHEILKSLVHGMPDTILDLRGKIRVKLGAENFSKFQKDSECELALKRLRDAGSPWNMVTDLRPVGDKTLLLTCVDEVWDDKIRLEAGRLGSIIGLDPDWTISPKRYCVEIEKYPCRHNENPRSQKETWSAWNGVKIDDAYILCSTLVLSMGSQEDAEKLCRSNGVILGRSRAPLVAKPVDLRAFDLWCARCNKPSHLRNECKFAVQCVQSAHYQCVNCPEHHRSASRYCKNSEVVRMLEECETWRKTGPSWARIVQQPQLPDEALMDRLRAYRNTPTGRLFLNTYDSAPEPRQFVSDRGSANFGATTATQPATKPTTNAKKRKGDWDSRDVSRSEPSTMMQVSQMNQRRLDNANKGSGPLRRGRGRPPKAFDRNNASKRRRGN
ncbi:hypothetical protein FBULB1_1924 [Fusarium bulbicola]|nr:hypothetical protein FBULB1_1924 [Fusarium bulbicola]